VGQEKKKPTIPAPNFEIIDSLGALEAFVRSIGRVDDLAVDLEADSMLHYQEKVCLIQIALQNRSVVIDPLKIGDLSSLKPVFADRGILKAFHGADYDIRSLYRDFDIEVNRLFDTQLASMYLGVRETSLDSVLQQRFRVTLDKKFQRKDWSQRPLPGEMIAYAAADVAFLIPLVRMLEAELKVKNRTHWVAEECALLSQVRPNCQDRSPLYLKFKGAGRLRARHLAALEGLLKFRKTTAHRKDKPLFKILSNTALFKIATAMPTDLERLAALNAISVRQLTMYGNGLVRSVNRALELPEENLPRYPRRQAPVLHPLVPERIKALRRWRDGLAEKLGLDPALLLNKMLLTTLAVENPASIDQLDSLPSMRNWQRGEFGKDIIQILRRFK
jgi:ribonuclease D